MDVGNPINTENPGQGGFFDFAITNNGKVLNHAGILDPFNQ